MKKTPEDIYDETIKYFKDNNLKPYEHINLLRFRIKYPSLSLQKAIEAVNSYEEKV